ncbi:MAG TPA: hypothetical protein VGR92_23250 [Steroidobacteraceae bacterium]|nr:hypothetical protein [Steroidobacteraceae bacterium]
MKLKLLSKRSTLHARAELIIPWLANGSLEADADPALREHVATCPECSKDYDEQLRVRTAMRVEGPLVFAAESSYQKLLARIQKPETGPEPFAEVADPDPSLAMHPVRRTSPVVQWLAAAAIVQAFAIGVGGWMWHSSSATRIAPYVTLTSASPSYQSGPRVRVLFKTDLSVGALQTLLQGAGAHIIDGPADGDVYTLGFAPPPGSPAALEKRIAALRANPAVLFAEPVQGGVR